MTQLVLSLFPGIGLLDMAFEQEAGRAIAHAWAAALIDGEGCISIGKARQSHPGKTVYYRADVKVSNCDRTLLEPLLTLFGGRIDHVRKDHATKRDAYQWTTTGSAHTRKVIEAVRPFLIAKRGQARLALLACALLTRKGGRRPQREIDELEDIKQHMHILNRRGKEEPCNS